jgi:hypothetical protein
MTKNIVSSNEADVQIVVSWLKGTDVEQALQQVHESEKRFEEAKKQLDGFKKKLARALMT